jgi:hypothetical protein
MPGDSGWWYGVAAALVIAVVAGVADWRRRRRRDLDAIGPIHWPTVQMLALIAAVTCGMMALHR